MFHNVHTIGLGLALALGLALVPLLVFSKVCNKGLSGKREFGNIINDILGPDISNCIHLGPKILQNPTYTLVGPIFVRVSCIGVGAGCIGV